MNSKKRIFTIGAALLTTGLVAAIAHARSMSPANGRPTNNNLGTFPYDSGGLPGVGIHNVDSLGHNLIWALPIDLPGNYTITLRAAETGAGAVNCLAKTIDPNTGVETVSNLASTLNISGVQTVTLPTMNVLAGGTLTLLCTLTGSDTSKIYTINW